MSRSYVGSGKRPSVEPPRRDGSDGRPRTPLLTVDCVLFDRKRRVLLIQRGSPPFQGEWALPGGFVDVGEAVEAAARRELLEETGVTAGKLALLGVYSDPRRDPRGHTVSVVFIGAPQRSKVTAGDDAAAARWVEDWRTTTLAFDHGQVLADAARWLARKTAWRER